MRKILASVLVAFCLTGLSFAQSSTMTDDQVAEYIQQGVSAGKSKQQLASELAMKGVSRAQMTRAANSLQNRQESGETLYTESRIHSAGSGEDTYIIRETVSSEPAFNPVTATSNPNSGFELKEKVFGMDIFRNKNLNFTPNVKLATPRSYRLGPGDEVIVEIFGVNQKTHRMEISPEGSINVDILGPIYLSGKTIEEANVYLKKRLSSIYSGLLEDNEGTDIILSLGRIRTIQVNVLGEVLHPGTYSLSSFSTTFHALYVAGGITFPGTLRNIKVNRNGEIIANADIYEFLTTGSKKSDIGLEDGDVILVQTYSNMVKIDGMVKRPMYYEMKEGESLQTLIDFAGGFANASYQENVSVIRQNGKNYEVSTVEKEDFPSFILQDGDEVTVGRLASRFENKLSVFGSVYLPGVYELNEEVNSVKSLVEKAGGLLPNAFKNRAIVQREHENLLKETISLNIGDIMSGNAPDIRLQTNDELHISAENAIQDFGDMTIQGMVNRPGNFTYATNTTVEDLILLAGGLRDGASLARVDIYRRNNNNNNTEADEELSLFFSIPIDGGLLAKEGKDFIISPYDIVVVKKSPSYHEQRFVSAEGEFNFAGDYAMTSKNERLSDLVKKAGGNTAFGYLKGARLYRRVNDVERRLLESKINTLKANGDTTSVEMLESMYEYIVAIELDKAISLPGSNYDITLRAGDRLVLPMYDNTVKMSGAVMNTSTLTYDQKLTARQYIELAGGFAHRAKRSKIFIINMNGSAQKYKPWQTVSPGSEIVVPKKEPREGGDILSNILGVATTAASLGTMTASITNLLRKP